MTKQTEYSINLDARFKPLELIDIQQLVDGVFESLLFLLQVPELLFNRRRVVVESVSLQPSCALRLAFALRFQIGILLVDEVELRLQAVKLVTKTGDNFGVDRFGCGAGLGRNPRAFAARVCVVGRANYRNHAGRIADVVVGPRLFRFGLGR